MIVESYDDVIVLSGALHNNCWDTLHTAVALKLKRYPQGIIIDCSQITDCTPRGAETFVGAMDFIESHDARVIVAAVPAHVLAVLRNTEDVRSQLPIAATIEDARLSLDMFNEHEDEPGDKKRKRKGEKVDEVLVVLNGSESDEWLMSSAVEYAEAIRARIELFYPIIIPRELSLNALLPDEERQAKASIVKAEKYCVLQHREHERLIERARDLGSAIEEALEGHPNVSQILIGLPSSGDDVESAMKVVRSVLTRISLPVLMIRGKVTA